MTHDDTIRRGRGEDWDAPGRPRRLVYHRWAIVVASKPG